MKKRMPSVKQAQRNVTSARTAERKAMVRTDKAIRELCAAEKKKSYKPKRKKSRSRK